MKKEVGLWIDHRKTVVVTISGKMEETTQIASRVEKHVRYAGGAEGSVPEDQVDRRFLAHLRSYYDEVIAHVRDAESILIMGPGEAKGELVKRLKSESLGERIVGVETVDKMTDPQIAARVRQQFHP
jgi:bisphosphoglycerate-dependent phosphoglycerate mutase